MYGDIISGLIGLVIGVLIVVSVIVTRNLRGVRVDYGSRHAYTDSIDNREG